MCAYFVEKWILAMGGERNVHIEVIVIWCRFGEEKIL